MIGRREFLAGMLALHWAKPARASLAAAPPEPDLDRLWQAFHQRFIQADGRVIDHGAEARSTSEGQAYALFHALVLDDRERFALLLDWTRNNLCGGDFASRLPAWSWGRRSDGNWAVLDDNNASDADLLICYCLAEAARLHRNDRWQQESDALLARLAAQCLRATRAFGPVLLPAARGFATGSRLRLNPSYLMRPLLARLAALRPDGPWPAVAAGARQLLLAAASPHGLARDWIELDADDPAGRIDGPAAGSYDAIRVYQWAGLAGDRELCRAYAGLRPYLRDGTLPERVEADRGSASGSAEPLMISALLPWLAVLGEGALLRRARAATVAGLARDASLRQSGYYSSNLALFSEGWWQRRYRFLPDGRLRMGSDG